MRTHLNVVRVVDGDGLIVSNLFNNEQEEIRLLGIDAPEIKRCRKLLQDEREIHIPGGMLIKLGHLSFLRLIDLLPIGANVTLIMQAKNQIDVYGRTLAYVFLNDGSCLNEIMVSEGFAKPYSKFNCFMQDEYQVLSSFAQQRKKGLYQYTDIF